MKIKTQLRFTMFLFGLLMVINAVLLLVTYVQIDRLNGEEETSGEVERAARELSYLSNDYLLNQEDQQKNRWLAESNALLEHLAQLTPETSDQRLLRDQIGTNQVRLRETFINIAAALEGRDKTSSEDLGFIRVAWSRLEVQNQTIVFDASRLTRQLFDQEDNLRQTSNMLLFGFAAIFGAYLLTNYFIIYRRTLRSLADLQTGAKIIGSGKLTYTLEEGTRDEIGELSRAFNRMTRNLREITASKVDLEREIAERQLAEDALRQSEANLRRSEARLRRLVDADIIGVLTRDASGRVEDANDAFLRLVGYTRADLEGSGMNIFDLIPPEDRPIEKQWMDLEQAAALAEQAEPGEQREAPGPLVEGSQPDDVLGRPREKWLLCKDGRRVPVLVGETRVGEGEPLFIGFVLDLSELKQVQAALSEYAEKLKRSNQELEQFAFIASHDLQEPLRKIRAFGDTLARKLGDGLDEEPLDYLKRMQNAASRMQEMIDDLLELSRVSQRGQAFVAVYLPGMIDEVISDLEPRILANDAQVQVDALPDSVEADPPQLRQLLQNLIGNAIKYHRPDVPPRVRVWGRLEPARPGCSTQVTLAVEDNGIGFSEEYLERIFQPFTRLHGRGEYEGTGMGLAICKKIVERHQGTITARSRPGEGSTFLVTLPAHQK